MKEIKKKFHPAQIVILAFLVVFGLLAGNILPQLKTVKAESCHLASNSTSCDGKDAYIDGETVTISGFHTFSNLTIKNGKLTHEAFTAGDDPTISGKKVDIRITGTLILETGGSIDADGKGYPGGYLGGDPSKDGYGPSAGKGAEFSWNGSGNQKGGEGGGGSFRGYGGDATDSNNNYYEKGNGGSTLYDQTSPLQVGSGGGGARYSQYTVPQLTSKGGAGGGRINIDTGSIYFNSTSSKISSNGQDGESKNSYPNGAYAGGGSGGSVKIVVSGEVKYPNASLVSVNVSEGIGGSGSSGGKSTGEAGYFNISAAGGNAHSTTNESAGGGGGGYVKISNPSDSTPPVPSRNECIIGFGQNSIPPSCENQDVIIDGAAVITSSHHNFKSLIIRNNGTLTHDAAAAGDNPASDKKVDLIIANNLTLESGGKIDVSGKGYPGGTANRIPNGWTDGLGCPPFAEGEYHQATASIYAKAGEGPGGGSPFYHCAIHSDTTVAGGAGYGGTGGDGRSDHNESIPGGSIYPVPYLGDYSSNEFEFGSGGGAATNKDGGRGAFAAGGAGGGRVYLQAQQIIFENNNSYIVANGYNGEFMSDWNETARGGGGSGGTIWVKTNSVTGQFSPQSYGAGNGNSGTVSNQNNFSLNAKTNGAMSGRNDMNEGGGAGGRIIIGPPGALPPPDCSDGRCGADCPSNYCPPPPPPPGTPTTAATVVVKVEWPEGLRTEKIELKTFLKN